MKLFKNFHLDYPQAIVLSVALVSFAAVYLFVPAETRESIDEGIAIAWAAAATIFGPLIRRRIQSDDAD